MKKAMAALILFLIETLLFYLYEMPLEAWAYSSVFILLIFGGWIILDEVQQRKKYKQLKNIQKEAEVYLETEHFGKPENAVEKEYQNLAEMLGRQWENARQEARCQISEANRYYIRWSHQIKTPIAALRLLLEEEEPDRAAMEGEIYRIEQYVEFALQYQRLEGGHKDLVFAHYSLESIVKKALKKTGVLFRRTKLALELGNLQTDVLTDEKWLVFVLEQLLNSGKITVEEAKKESMNGRGEALISFLGIGGLPLVDSGSQAILMNQGDIVILASDGLYKGLTAVQIQAIVEESGGNMSIAAERLCKEAQRLGECKQDNTTVIAVRYSLGSGNN